MKVCAQKSVAARAELNGGAQNLMICFAGGIVLRLAGPVLAVMDWYWRHCCRGAGVRGHPGGGSGGGAGYPGGFVNGLTPFLASLSGQNAVVCHSGSARSSDYRNLIVHR